MGKEGYHFIGLGGIGMSALASILLDQEISVAGSDLSESSIVKKLARRGASFKLGHAVSNVSSGQTVVYTSSVKKENPEFQAAEKLSCKMMHRSDLLKELMKDFQSLAVAGAHGKTTTSALLVHTLTQANYDPSYAIGGLCAGENGKAGKGKYFVAEADESDGTFLKYHPFGAIVTNVEKEHMDHYETEEKLHDAFSQFFSQVTSSEHLFYCGDDPHLHRLSKKRGISYGFGENCDLRILSFSQKEWNISLDLSWKGEVYHDVRAAFVGKMNALNVTAVFGLSLSLGISEEIVREALLSFPGVKRRLEKKGFSRNVLCLDDYGHHPTEIRLTLRALKDAIGDRRLIVLFQPHRFTRTRDFLSEFAKSFENADLLFVADIYSAQESPISGINADILIEKIREVGTVPTSKFSNLEELAKQLRPHDVVLTLGAGNVTEWSDALLANLEKSPPQKYRLGVIFGGRSPEHEISLRSCRFVKESLNPDYYEVSYFAIDKKGFWVVGDEASQILDTSEITVVQSENAKPLLSADVVDKMRTCDLFFPILHGANGEDGTIQGFFEMLGKPYVGPDFRSCAITMDKVMTKRILREAGVPTSDFVDFNYQQWLKNKEHFLFEAQKLTFPVFVKPSKMGSSIGVVRVDEFENLSEAVEIAFKYDDVVLIEEGVMNARELEFPVMGSRGNVSVPHPGEKCAEGKLVDYNMKYSQNSVRTTIHPILSKELLEKGLELAKRAYEALNITCMTRVDCLLDPEGNFFFFEVNAIPGLTKLSLFPKLWARDGVMGPQLMDRMVVSGLSRRHNQDRHEKLL